IACDGLSTRLADAQQALATLAANQTKLTPIAEQISRLETDLSAAGTRMESLRQDEEALAAQERGLRTLNESACALAQDLAAQLHGIRELQTELTQAGALKEQLCADLAAIQSMQRETFAATREGEDQLRQLSARCQQITQQRSQLELAERAIAGVESRLG